MDRYICIHGHFYQPPRENPWLEEVELQDGAYPYHDWNERITAECYAPNAASRILDPEERIIEIVNVYSKSSFNFGPSLLTWLERRKSDVYEAILEADRLSIARFSGHGSAIAQAYSHMILPLANKRDMRTQIVWGIKDFEKRFMRFPEGMWLPETAVNTETLEVLAELGIKFTILSPRQAQKIRKRDTPNWLDVSGERIDPTMPYLCMLPSGKSINIFFYDGPIAQEVSFAGLLKNGEGFARKLLSAFNDQRNRPQLVHIATDGENYGHHHRFGDMALSYCLHYIESNNLAKITNYGEYLEKHPPTHAVEIIENSSWSCIHGVERWRSNCGCNTGMHHDWNQKWRRPLRDAMDSLRDTLVKVFESEASNYFKDPWGARDGYIDAVFDRSVPNVENYLKSHARKELAKEEKVKALGLLEMQRNAMLMYTSCGWFFDDVSGIEGVQTMQYASRAIQYAEDLFGLTLEADYLMRLGETPSNVFGNAARVYDLYVKPARTDLLRVGAHYGISSFFEKYNSHIELFCYIAENVSYNKTEAGKLKLATGKAVIRSNITWEEKPINFAVLHLGDHNISGGAEYFIGDEDFSAMQNEIQTAFDRGDMHEVIRFMDKHFGGNIYSIWHLFKDEQRKILNQILRLTYASIEASYRQIYENHYAVMNFFHSLKVRLPRPFSAATEYILNTDLKKIFDTGEELDLEKLKSLADEAVKWSLKIDSATIGFSISSWVNSLMEKLSHEPEDLRLFELIDNAFRILNPLSLTMDLWKAQNLYFMISKKTYITMKERAKGGDEFAKRWVEAFRKLGYYLHIKVT
ncbi:MAG: DUF3536 domain-containing protein [Thermodesulfovibrionia bacterium]|nr:DUF3536 domain-containing protein [Thermodesulfovibrionia bacterium]